MHGWVLSMLDGIGGTDSGVLVVAAAVIVVEDMLLLLLLSCLDSDCCLIFGCWLVVGVCDGWGWLVG